MKLLHTADWQIGRPYASVESSENRTLLQQARIDAIDRIAEAAREEEVQGVLIAGDLFDSPTASARSVAAACAAIGRIPVPVFAIPGNHDHGGPGSVWEQAFFQRERDRLAPNFFPLLKPEPHDWDHAVILPCPLLRRAQMEDPTAWLQDPALFDGLDPDKPRIVLAHGSVREFSATADLDELDDSDARSANRIHLDRMPADRIDYIALGDWHGTFEAGPRAWYSGTPEPDRFRKGGDHDPGNVLLVEVARGCDPVVRKQSTAGIRWFRHAFSFTEDADLEAFIGEIDGELGRRVQRDVIRLELEGQLGISATARLEEFIESLRARTLRVRMAGSVALAPTEAELDELTMRTGDPLITRVAGELRERSAAEGDDARTARRALRLLHRYVAATGA